MATKHSTRAHAVLSASASSRWLACPPSAKLNAEIPDTTTDYAREGTCAHELAEYKVNKLLGIEAKDPTENLDFYDSEMEDCTESYAQYIAEQISKYSDPVVMVEQRLDFSKYVPGGFGTGDCIIVADDVLTVIDYKHGKGVAVSAERNSQMMLYALGALELFDSLYDIKEICMVIFQPRIENVSESVISVSDLLHWAENELRPKAELAEKGEGEFCAGEHCRFCKVKATCRKRAEYNLTLAQYDFAPAATLEDTEIEAILEKADALTAWAADVKEYALSQALAGKQWTGYKVVEGRSNRKYTDEKAVAEAVKAIGEKLKGNGKSVPPLNSIKTPLRDGDVERPDDEAYANSYFINANSASAPGIVDAACQPIIDTSEVYSGVYGRASINFYAFNSNGNKGIACGLNNLQKIRDGESLGGKSRAEDDFADLDDDFLN